MKQSNNPFSKRLKQMSAEFDELTALHGQMDSLLRPVLTDLQLMPAIYDLLIEHFGADPAVISKKESVRFRKECLLIIISLYSPMKLFGGKMRFKVRDTLTDVMKLETSGIISNDCRDLIFQYSNYTLFRDEVDLLYKQLLESLKQANYLPLGTIL